MGWRVSADAQGGMGIGQVALEPTRLCSVCRQLPRARPALVLVQQQARLVPPVCGHRACSVQASARPWTTRCRDDGPRGRSQSFHAADDVDLEDTQCPACQGARLNPKRVRCVLLAWALTRWRVCRYATWRTGCSTWHHGQAADIARDLLPEIASRLKFLQDVGRLPPR